MTRRCRDRGQGLVEFALVLPLLLLLVFGLMEFGRAWMTQNILTGAAREGVRRYAVQDNAAAAIARAEQILSSAGLDVNRWNVTPGTDNGVVSVTVDYAFPVVIPKTIVPGLNTDNITLSSTTTMRREY